LLMHGADPDIKDANKAIPTDYLDVRMSQAAKMIDVVNESRAVLEECSHVFCQVCIDRWTDIRLRCPVCNKELKALGTTKTVPSKNAFEADEQFECLDHGYFKVEFLKLQTKFNNTKLLMQKNTKLSHNGGSRSVLEMLGIEIAQKLRILTDFDKFNAKECLEDTYRIDQSLKDLGSGNYVLMDFQLSQQESDYYLEEGDEYDDDYYDEDYAYSEDDDDNELYNYRSCQGPNKRAKAKPQTNKKSGTGNAKSSQARVKC